MHAIRRARSRREQRRNESTSGRRERQRKIATERKLKIVGVILCARACASISISLALEQGRAASCLLDRVALQRLTVSRRSIPTCQRGSGLELNKMDQQYKLRWHNHPANLTDVLSSLLAREALCDVTLACVGETFKAHQTILSACSPYFENIFLQNIHPHPIIFLKDVNDTEMKALLHFMYKGEVNVSQHLLPMFLKTAEALQIRGLTNDSVNNDADEKSPSPEPEAQPVIRHSDSPSIQSHPEKRKRKMSGNYDNTLSGPPSEKYHSDSQASSQCSYKSSPTVPKLNYALAGNLEDGRQSISPQSQSQAPIKQEIDHHMSDFHDNISMPAHPVSLRSEDSGPTTGGSLNDSVPGIESSEHHNPPEVVDGLDELKNWRISQIFERQSNTDERRRCSLCGKVVTNVRNHYYVHFPGKYACPLCPAVYTRSDTLLTHTRTKHVNVQ
ncbi:sex determination protein fruitless isoform X4 [Phymastichus coffea]|uniref:sex determination protein fruitless isoform X4 n=1 Tax=Phymastichus coffea TaxID=108790 RepID=UPI00273BB3F7|nr:sex determination protein fruitless isoform X4 [Phymastichus coffea]